MTPPSDASVRPSGISRRTLVKGAAWSVPAVTVLGATPAMASSGPPPRLMAGSACKNPGNSCKERPKGYTFPFMVYNDSPLDIWVYNVTISSPALADLTFANSEPPLPFMVPAAVNGVPGTVPVFFNASSANSANLAFTATVTVFWSHEPNPNDDDWIHQPVVTQVSVGGTPPNCICPS